MYLYMTGEAEFDKLCPFGSVYTHHQLCLLPPPQHPIFPKTPPSTGIDQSTGSRAECSSG